MQEKQEKQENKAPSINSTKNSLFQFAEKKEQIFSMGNEYEGRTENFLLRCATKAIKAFFIFKRRKGDLVAGCATFFALLSFCPVILLLISMMSLTIEGEAARDAVMNGINASFPHLAKWIYESIYKIVTARLSGEGSSVANLILLLYSTLGVVASVMFGVQVMAKSEQKGGFILEDGKALISGVFMYGFMFCLILVGQKSMMTMLFSSFPPGVQAVTNFLIDKNIAPVVLSLSFFTVFYKWAPPIVVTWKKAFVGAVAFVSCFAFGKSFYWVYLQFARADIQANYGNFETLITAVMWVYFLKCSFFYGAAMAYMPEDETESGKKALPDVPQSENILDLTRETKSDFDKIA